MFGAKRYNRKKLLNMEFVNNLKESYTELVHKVSWPTRKELSKSAVLVLIASIILALIVWLMDFGFEWIMTKIYGLF
jgi:preprotein translocase subunit SecE